MHFLIGAGLEPASFYMHE